MDNFRARALSKDRKTREIAEAVALYQNEVLNKCEGRPANTGHPSWRMFCKIAWYAPDPIIHAALEAMQDARNNNLNPDMKHVGNLTKYYLGTVRTMCREQGVETPIKWGGDAE